MQTKSDAELLSDYAANKSEAAFGEIVRRYADFVYSAALRQLGSPEPARDVAQTVFTDLARKAGALPANTLLIGWLCYGARLAALEQLRRDRRRLHRERQPMEWHEPSSEVVNDWGDIRPVLDEALRWALKENTYFSPGMARSLLYPNLPEPSAAILRSVLGFPP